MKIIPLDPYPGKLYVAKNAKEYAAYRKRLFKADDKYDPTGSRGSFWCSGGCCLIWAGKDALLHELTHVALHMFDYVGIDPIASSGEAFCYFLEHLYHKAK